MSARLLALLAALAAAGTGADALGEARTRLRAGDYAGAERSAAAAAAERPDDPEVLETLAWARLQRGDFGAAIADASRAAAADPARARAYVVRAFGHELMGDRPNVLRDLGTAAALDERCGPLLAQAAAGRPVFARGLSNELFLDGLAPADGRPGPRRGAGASASLAAALALGAAAFAVRRRKAADRPAAPSAPPLQPPPPAAAEPAPPPAAVRPERTAAGVRTPRPPGSPPAGARERPAAGRDKYEAVRLLGRNEDGRLWEGFDRSLQRAVALEEIELSSPELRDSALRRARELALLHHPAILDLYDVVDLGARLWLVFELIDGRTLRDALARDGRLRFEEGRRLLAPVCEALAFAHDQGIVHGHLRPSRIVLAEAGYVKVSGFEVLRGAGRARRYLAPEAELGRGRAESDVFSLGACLYEALAGAPPYADEDDDKKRRLAYPRLAPRALDAPPGLEDLIARSLSPVPETRIRTAGHFLDLLRALRPSEPAAPSRRPSRAKTPWPRGHSPRKK